MIKIAIVEDEKTDYDLLTSLLDRYSKENAVSFDISSFGSADEFLKGYKPVYDLILMDIMMPGTNGMESAKKLRELDQDTILIFITTISRMAIDGYTVDAFDYILKPLDYPSFSLKFKRILGHLRDTSSDVYILKSGGETVILKQSEIIYVEVMNHNLTIHAKSGDYGAYGSLKSISEELSPFLFEKCSSSFLINLSYVTKIEGYRLYLGSIGPIQISRPQKARFINKFHVFLKGG